MSNHNGETDFVVINTFDKDDNLVNSFERPYNKEVMIWLSTKLIPYAINNALTIEICNKKDI